MGASGFTLPPVDRVAISLSPGELRAASLREGRPWDLFIARASRPALTGNVYLARVRRLEPGLDAAFLDIGEAEPAFLPLARARPSEGAALLVQIARDGFDGKGPTASARIALPSRTLVYTPGRPGLAASRHFGDAEARRRAQGVLKRLLSPDEGAILRLAAMRAEPDRLAADLEAMRRVWREIQDAVRTAQAPALLHRDLPPLLRFLRDRATAGTVLIDDRRAFAEAERFAAAQAPDLLPMLRRQDDAEPLFESLGIESEIERALETAAPLPGGGALHVETTRALTAIDVDSGSFTDRRGAGETMLHTGLEAAVEAARLLRFRNIGGLIVIDFAAPADRAYRRRIDDRLRAAFAEDVADTRFVPMSDLGLIEMSRQRLGPPLAEILGERCGRCGGTGWTESPETAALAALRAVLRAAAAEPGGRVSLAAAPAVVDLLEGALGPARQEVEARLGRPLPLRRWSPTGRLQAQVEMVR